MTVDRREGRGNKTRVIAGVDGMTVGYKETASDGEPQEFTVWMAFDI